jgi:phosphohistidine phosphatase SixA
VLSLAKIDPQAILTSGLRRADESAAIASELFPACPVTTTQSLLPTADPAELWSELCASKLKRVLLAGHEPHLSQTVAYLLAVPISIDFKKGALVRIDAPRKETPQGTLRWMLTPRLARTR